MAYLFLHQPSSPYVSVYHSCPLFSNTFWGSELITKNNQPHLTSVKNPDLSIGTVGSRLLVAQSFFCLCLSLTFGRSNINFKSSGLVWSWIPGTWLSDSISIEQLGMGLVTTDSLSKLSVLGSNFYYCLAKVARVIIQSKEHLPLCCNLVYWSFASQLPFPSIYAKPASVEEDGNGDN